MIMVNYKVHRVRFVPYIPQAIHCLVTEKTKQTRLAVSRYKHDHRNSKIRTCFMVTSTSR